MNAIEFPKMFNTSNARVITDRRKATLQNLQLLINCEKGEFFGDPFFGIRVKRYIFNQNNYVLRDILIDEIYSQVLLFVPQVTIKRSDIKIVQEGKDIIIRLKVMDNEDFTTNMYDLVLFHDEER